MRVRDAEERLQRYIERYDMAGFLNDDLLRHLQIFRFPAYSNIYMEQDEQHVLYFLVAGQVQCSHYHPNGKLAVLALTEPFAVIGDVEIFNTAKMMSNVVATRDTVMLGIYSDFVHRYGAEDPRFLRFIIDQLSHKFYQNNALQRNWVLPVINRLALYILSQRVNEQGWIVFPDKEELASLMGTTTRHLNRVLRELADAELIHSEYPLVRMLDRAVLQELTC